MGVIKKLDTYLKEKLQEKLNQEQALRYRDMERYSRHIEELYKEVRAFCHDYANLLTSLSLGIEEEDMEQIKRSTTPSWRILVKIAGQQIWPGPIGEYSGLCPQKSPRRKIYRSQRKGYCLNVEVPEEIHVEGMSLLDFLTIVSILCDNAIEASAEASQPYVSIAF